MMLKMRVFKGVNRSKLPCGAKPIDGTWALHKKSNKICCSSLTMRGFKHVDDVDYASASIHTPVTNAVSVRLILTPTLMAG